MALNRCAYIILGIMQKKKAVNEMRGMTIYEIKDFERISGRNTIYKRLREMQKLGYVNEGAKVGKAKSYYLTEKGQAFLSMKKGDTYEE